MEIDFNIETIKNAKGEGNEQRFVSLKQHKAAKAKELEKRIEQSTSLTKGDVRAALSELRHIIEQDLSEGRRFHLDGIGYLSLAAGFALPDDKRNGKITGNDIFLRGINFRPERELIDNVRQNVNFRHSRKEHSAAYTADELWQKVNAYLAKNSFLTVRIFSEQFALKRYAATKWLERFVQEGKLRKESYHRQQLFFRA